MSPMRLSHLTVMLTTFLVLLSQIALPASAAVRSSSFRSGSSRYSSYRSGGYRSASYSGSVSGVVRSRFSVSVQTFALSRGIFYSRYRTYNSKSLPTLCVNVIDPLSQDFNSTVVQPWYYRNTSVLGIFVCPLDDNAGRTYCCGTELAEYCCTFWDDPGRIASVVVAIVVGLAVLAYFCYRLHRKFFSIRAPPTAYAAEMSMANAAYVESDKPPAYNAAAKY